MNIAVTGQVDLHWRNRGAAMFNCMKNGTFTRIPGQDFCRRGQVAVIIGYEYMHRGGILYYLNTGQRGFSDIIDKI